MTRITRAGRATQHLAETVRDYGPTPAADEVMALLAAGIKAKNDAETARRIAERGTADKLNPHASDAGKSCLRQTVYSLLNVPKSNPPDLNAEINFAVGHAVEEMFADILGAAMPDAKIRREVHFSIPVDGTHVSGRTDFIIESISRNTLIELKAKNAPACGYMIRNGEQGQADHRRQVNLYMHASHMPESPFSHPYDEAWLVYIANGAIKGEPVVHAFTVAYDPDMAREDLRILANAKNLADAGTLPDRAPELKRSAFPCSYCNWKSHCWSN